MGVSLLQAVAVALLAWLTHTAILGYAFLGPTIWSPIVYGPILGLIFGDMPRACMVTAAIQLPYIGMIGAGMALPSDPSLAGLVGGGLALATRMSPEMAVTLAVPIGLLGLTLHQIRMTSNSYWQHLGDLEAEKPDGKRLWQLNVLIPQLVLLLLYGVPSFVAMYYGNQAIQTMLDIIPVRVTHALEVIGGMMPAIGIGVTLKVIGKTWVLPFFFIGFFLNQYLALDILPIAVLGTCSALIYIQLSKGGTTSG